MEHTPVCLVCLIGLPASGKSTLARKIEARYMMKYNVDIVTFDEEIVWDEVDTWKNKRNSVYNMVVNRIEKYLTILNRDTIVILDDNMFYRSMRYKYYQLAKKYGISFCEIYLCTPLSVCLKLNKQRTNPVAESAIINMNAKLESPAFRFNKWEMNSLIVTQMLRESDWVNLEEMIHCSLKKPLKVIDRSHNETNSLSTLHAADIALRKVVNAHIKERKESSGNSKQYCLDLANKRHQILECIRTGGIILPDPKNVENCVQLYTDILRPYLLEDHHDNLKYFASVVNEDQSYDKYS